MNTNSYSYLATALECSRQFTEALAVLHTEAQIDPDSYFLSLQEAYDYLAMGQPGPARTLCSSNRARSIHLRHDLGAIGGRRQTHCDGWRKLNDCTIRACSESKRIGRLILCAMILYAKPSNSGWTIRIDAFRLQLTLGSDLRSIGASPTRLPVRQRVQKRDDVLHIVQSQHLVLIPPIHSDNLPFTVGFQAKYRFNQADGAGPQTEHLRSVMEVSNGRGILIHLSQLPYSHR
jgi:hypothetical protein